MLKRILLILLAIAPLAVMAQVATGEWYTYPTFTGKVSQMVATADRVYYLSEGSLFSYDTTTNELYSYTKRNLLNDNQVSFLRYNPAKGYLAIVYANCNIDLLYDDDTVVNMADIKEAVLNITTDKAINDVSFYGDRMLVATTFGIVVYDDKRHCVSESGVYGMNVRSLVGWRDKLYILTASNIYASPIAASHFDISSFTNIGGSGSLEYLYTNGDDDKVFYGVFASNGFYRVVLKDDGTINYTGRIIAEKCSQAWTLGNGEGLAVVTTSNPRVIKVKNNEAVETVTISTSLPFRSVATYGSVDKGWVSLTGEGVGYYNLADATPIVSACTPDASTVKRVAYLRPSWDFERLYVSNIGITHYKNCNSGNANGVEDMGSINVLANNVLSDVTLYNTSGVQEVTVYCQNKFFDGVKGIISPTQVCEDRFEAGKFYAACSTEGVYVVKDGVEIGKYDHTNSNMPVFIWSSAEFGGVAAYSVGTDRWGNLWVLFGNSNLSGVNIDVLPYAKTQLPTDQVQASDWIQIRDDKLGSNQFTKDADILICRHSNMIFFLQGYYNTNLVAYDTKGTETFADDEFVVWNGVVPDQDGKDFDITQKLTLAEGNDGRVWIGGINGIAEITDPYSALSPSFTVNRLKVPRNDGTNFADYLLEGETITDIAVDPSNRKWLATMSSGLYLVSANGDEVVEHFTAENSYLPDNQVNVVYADPLSSLVYIGTNSGLTFYNSTSAPASSDYSEVYAFPNPVRPEYTGWITIKELMDNSYVKIADASGIVLNQGMSQGGMYMWDGCDMNGNRVKSGVYYVFASTSVGGTSTSGKAVTKILVVN